MQDKFLSEGPQQEWPPEGFRHAGSDNKMTTHITQLLAKGFSLAVLGFLAAVTMIMAFAPAGSIYNG